MTETELRSLVVGTDKPAPLYGGGETVYANLDNAASTPALKYVAKAVNQVMEWYASIHRGAGYKSQVASELYEQAREEVMRFTGADPDAQCVILTHNTTDAINRLAHKFPRDNDRSVIISHVEHHANDLPWRDRGRVVRVRADQQGFIDTDDLEHALRNEGNKARLVSLTGASNVTGTLQPIHEFARIAHRHGVPIAIDAAQLAPHVPINMTGYGEDDRIDFLMLSAHKMYAPFGGGALVGLRDFFADTAPSLRGGGAVKVVEPYGVDWSEPPERDEAGSPNVIGAIAVAAAMRELQRIGWDVLEEAERHLTRRFLEGLAKIDGAQIYGPSLQQLDNRLGVIAFNLNDIPHALVASILSHEYGIGVRNGCFCAHPFVITMLGIDDNAAEKFRAAMRSGDKSEIPGAVRASFGLYNTEAEIDRVLDALGEIARGKHQAEYHLNSKTGEYLPAGSEIVQIPKPLLELGAQPVAPRTSGAGEAS